MTRFGLFRLLIGMSLFPVVANASNATGLLPYPRKVDVGTEMKSVPHKEVEAVDSRLPAEGYRLDLGADRVTVSYGDEAGRFYAHETLDALRREGKTRVVRIEDAPAFKWRGLMLDEARHFFGKAAVKRFLDRMARLKLNVFHWHLTDHQGWRIEIRRCPELTAVASVRNVAEWRRLRPIAWADPEQEDYGPFFYTQDDVREIVAYAAARHITVIPEIEIPGHCRAILRARPQLQCENVSNRLDEVEEGYRRAVVCAGRDETLRFFENVLDEVCELFPSPIIHIGGDEVRKDFWRGCPRCQARLRQEGLKDEVELQAWLTRHFAAHLARKGRRIVGWDEMTEGGVGTNAVALCWRERELARRAVARGHEVVLCPEEYCYFDFQQGLPDDDHAYHPRGDQVFAPLTVQKVYSFNPLAWAGTAQRAKVLGAQGNNWTELSVDEAQLDWKIWMRAAALAEVLWTAPEVRDFKAFRPRLEAFRSELEQAGARVAQIKEN